MKDSTQKILIVWFIVINLFILVPSFNVLWKTSGADSATLRDMPNPPEPPEPPTLPPFDATRDPKVQEAQVKGQVDTFTQRIAGYTQRITAYTQQIAAYKSQIETAKPRQIAAYQLVVKDTLTELLKTLLTALVGFVFAKAGAEVVSKYIMMKRAKAGTAPPGTEALPEPKIELL